MTGRYDVLVIGTGFAGLGAGLKLNQSGCKYKLLEVRNRAGGRARTIVTPSGVAAEEGATWLHGRDQDALLPYVRKFELAHSLDATNLSSIREGKVGGRELRDAFLNAIEESFARAQARNPNADGPLEAFIDDENLRELARYRRETWASGIGAKRVSTRDFLGDPYGSGGYVMAKGMGALVSKLVDCIPPENISYHTSVEHISPRRHKDGVCVTAVDTISGEETRYKAEKLIFTGSIGYLEERASELFPSELAEQVLESIAPLGMGHMTKVTFELNPDWMKNPRHHNQHIDVIDHSALVHVGIGGKPQVSVLFGGKHAVNFGKMTAREQRKTCMAVLRELRHLPHMEGIMDAMVEDADPVFKDWRKDPHARGAYSTCYVGDVRPSKPVQIDNVILAGEAFSDRSGHVSGAFCSGELAAAMALKRPARIITATHSRARISADTQLAF